METTTNAWAEADLIRPHVARMVVSNPVKTRIVAVANIRTDKVDAEVLTQLPRWDYLPEVWAPDVNTRPLRRLCSQRAGMVCRPHSGEESCPQLVGQPVNPGAAARHIRSSRATWLDGISLPAEHCAVLSVDLRLLGTVNREIVLLNKQLQARAYHDDRVRLLVTLPGLDTRLPLR